MPAKMWYSTAALTRNDPRDSWWVRVPREEFPRLVQTQFTRMRWSRFAHLAPTPEQRGMSAIDLYRLRKRVRADA